MIHPLLLGRFLFVVDECPRCSIYKEFIEKVNSELKFDKRVEVIDCTRFHDFGIIDNPIIRLFQRYIQGEYPVLFIRGRRKDGTNTRIEAEAWLRGKLHEDFIFPQGNEWLPNIKQFTLFDKECKFGKKGIFKKRIICEGL